MKQKEFDYVIIGAGSAGCALARRLSDFTNSRILVLEAGGNDSRPEIHDPSLWSDLLGTEVDWGYETIRQPHANDRVFEWPRGRMLGGSSSLNGMVYIQGDPLDFDSWAFTGSDGWSNAEVRECFRAMEGRDSRSRQDVPRGDLLRPSTIARRSPMSQVFIDACVEIGIPFNRDLNEGSLVGAGWNELCIFEGKRQSSYRAFLQPIIESSNVQVETNSVVHKIEINSKGVIESITYYQNGKASTVSIAGEVILSAGAVDSARLLLLSGIGPAQELERIGIKTKINSPEVGKNLVDHMLIGVAYAASREIVDYNKLITENCAFVKSNPKVLGSDIEISFVRSAIFVGSQDIPENSFTLVPGICRPQSKGSIVLASSDPSASPLIDPNYLSEDVDVQALVRGIEISREIGSSRAFRSWIHEELSPGPRVQDQKAIREYVRAVATTWFHPVGTCRMGKDSNSVVAPDLKVRGTKNLRVADASIMPSIVSCNTNPASMMIGWKAGNLIADAL